jgi:aminopeptidase-like protein
VSLTTGEALHAFAARLYPICRSITGNGVRETLRLVAEQLPLTVHEVPSGTRVFDWEVPAEWNITDAALLDADGRRVVDFRAHNLHIVSYSEPQSVTLPLTELAPRLHSLPEHPEWIPYRTSYYRRNWGFCLSHNERERMRPGAYRVEIKSTLAPGSLTYAEAVIPGTSADEVLFFAHVCHPSLANDNTSGIAIATALAQWLAAESRRYTYRFVFAPGTIGSLCWLRANESRLGRVRHGLVLALLGDPAPLTYKMSRRETSEIDAVAGYVLPGIDPRARVIGFSPYGYDERQLCSPGFNLPVGRLTRSVNGGYPQYHSSGDDLSLIKPGALQQSLEACQRIVEVLEDDRRYLNLSPKGEPLLGKRGLYGAVGGVSPATREQALLWVLNQSDGSRSLLEVARRSGMDFRSIRDAARALEAAGLLRAEPARAPVRRRRRASSHTSRAPIHSKRKTPAKRGGKK